MSIPKLDQSLSIGPVALRNRVLLAPMSGVSDLPFRKRAWQGGAGAVVSEMIASREYCNGTSESLMRSQWEGCGPAIMQLAGRDPHWIAEAARLAQANGAEIIDLNMGCPAKKVIGGAAGSALMREPDLAISLVEAAAKAVSVPVTVKMRLGWDDNSINAAELAERAVDAGAQMITVHGRTRCQFYEGRADWDRIAEVRERISVPLVVNGDIVDANAAENALQASGADAVMIGRAAYGRPWAPGQIAGVSNGSPALTDFAAYVISHYRDMLAHYGERTGIRHARKHLGWYCNTAETTFGLEPDLAAELKGIMMTAKEPDIVEAAISRLVPEREGAATRGQEAA